MNVLEKFCPICKNKNDRYAIVCIHCGAQMEENAPTDMVRTTRNTGGLFIDVTKIPETVIDNKMIPDDGIAIYVAGTLKPIYLQIKNEFIIGRKPEKASENFLDLSDLDGFNMGLSRKHAIIHRVESGFEVTDLSSTNGTWMEDERLAPEKPYPLKNGTQLRLGRLRLLVVHNAVVEETNKE